ncbi:MAG: DNA polymerase III subunit gamma/tau [Candidatus Marinimicrobia bacterium]|nr:DNA polymerase III subunit gamma/tau [Candidatus Neomarinimicrobiota bacterium]MBT4362177.1 DNA polymerase III subunit gamma/tau [Candidatus Neomarinimicrobiota bacterium]MBT4716237.1 DNA polymerase III subunit gamma/tau [Candidatus Neomarinimicrobiota bacterium]MBT4944647.1 DNA polymerase III subunit gamma/tau [Candidatus Neomarinimicrobiota bacterium]MBT5270169.1 DNA polymerase III subunit gamma/tau [Candidatus Neomarinimicrobiota bacterium]
MSDQESAYIVSSLKYRPQTFEDVVGQDHVSRTLRNALLRHRLANGYIFTGPRGVGKTTSARILAKAINCENPNDGNPCNTCNHCIEITAGRSLDVLEVDGASTRGIDAIRELREVVKYPPTNSNYRVYIIDEVHMLTKEAFNALLKTLEEPPPQVLFIFATTEPQKVPLTILSRCQRYDFRMISTETMVARLKMISDKEGISISEDGLALIARKAAGSLRDSLSLLDQVSAFSEDEASIDLVRRVLGVLDATIYFELLHNVASQSAENLMNQANLLFSRGISISEFLHGLSEHIRNLLIVKVAGITDYLDVSDTDAQALEEQAAYFEERDLLRMQNIVLETIREQRFVSNQLVSVELMLLKLSRSTRALDLDAILTGKSAPAMQLPKVAPPKITPSPSEEESAPKKSAPQPKPAPAPEPEATSEAPELIKPEPVKETVKKPEQVPPLEPVVVEEIIPEPTPEPVPEAVPEVKEVLEVESNPPADEQSSDINIEELLPHWEKFIESLGKISRSTSAFMSEGTPAGFEKGCLTVSFAPEQKYHIQTLSKNTDDIHKIASEVFGTKMTILLLEENGRKPKQRKEDEILAHPTSQHLLDIFDGEIIDE